MFVAIIIPFPRQFFETAWPIKYSHRNIKYYRMMLERKISGYLAEFSCHEHQLLINITHPNKQIMLFGRFTNDIFPDALREIADNIFELHEIIKETPDDKLQVTHNHELVIAISIGKRSKEYAIPLEKADLSKEDSLSKKVEDLQKQLERMTFEATFYKQQYQFLLKNLQLKPNVSELEKIYARDDISQLFRQEMKESHLTSCSNSSKVGSALREQPAYRCPNNHKLQLRNQPVRLGVGYRCNICLKSYSGNTKRMKCQECDFDVCEPCTKLPQNKYYCPKLHALTFGVAKNYEYRLCDICESSLLSSKGYSCVVCDYDLCKECV